MKLCNVHHNKILYLLSLFAKGEAGPDQTADPEVTFDNAEISRQSSLLAGKQFYLDGFAEDWIQPLGELIESNGGQVVHDTQRILCDFAVLPMNKKPSEGMKAMQMASPSTL